MTLTAVERGQDRLTVLREVEQRVLWLATAIVDHANRVRPNPSGLKVGGHQASSASMATIMTALWFEHLTSADRVSVKPHASPVRVFQRAGRPVLAGTDANDDTRTPFQPPHGAAMHDELRRLVAAGLSPAEALRGATTLAAATFGLTDRGAIEPGRRADLVLVAGDPTRDITATRDIRAVWIGGEQREPR